MAVEPTTRVTVRGVHLAPGANLCPIDAPLRLTIDFLAPVDLTDAIWTIDVLRTSSLPSHCTVSCLSLSLILPLVPLAARCVAGAGRGRPQAQCSAALRAANVVRDRLAHSRARGQLPSHRAASPPHSAPLLLISPCAVAAVQMGKLELTSAHPHSLLLNIAVLDVRLTVGTSKEEALHMPLVMQVVEVKKSGEANQLHRHIHRPATP